MRLAVYVFLYSFVVNTYAQTEPNKSIEGIIRYPVTVSVPQGIIFIPVHPNELSTDMSGHWLYFQAMRWTQRDLLLEINKCKKERVVVEGIVNHFLSLLAPGENNCYMTYGKVNLRAGDVTDERDDSEVYALKVPIGGKSYNIRYKTAPRSFGIPMTFECLGW